MTLQQRIILDRRQAMTEGNRLYLETLGGLLSRFSQAEAVEQTDMGEVGLHESEIAGASWGLGSSEVPRKVLSPQDELEVIRLELSEIDQALRQLPPDSDYWHQMQHKRAIVGRYIEGV